MRKGEKWREDEKVRIGSERKGQREKTEEILTCSFQFSMLWRQGLKTDGCMLEEQKVFMMLPGLQVAGWVSLCLTQPHLILPLLHPFALNVFFFPFNEAICNFHTTCV